MALTIIAGDAIEIEANREDGRVWWAQNGAKRTRLALYAAQGVHIERVDTEVYLARDAVPVWTGEEWHREAAVYLYPTEKDELHVVWLNTHCGFGVTPKDAVLWEASSFGGPKNNESKIAVLKPPCYIEEFTYKFSTPSDWYSVTLDGAVRRFGTKSNIIALALRGDKDAKRLAEFKGWLSELTGELEVQDEL